MTKSLKIVFFGSGPVASKTLQALLPHFDVEAIITKPRAEGHRGSVPVLELAEEQTIPVFTPGNKKELTDLFASHTFTSSVGLVVDYGIIISNEVIDSFALGIVNSHFSLLPEWRGADPITFSVLSGQKETGVSLMVINEKLDEGTLIAQKPLTLPPTITTPQLTDELITLSNAMLIEYMPQYAAGKITPYQQPNKPVTYSRKLTKEDGILDTKKPATQLEREIRAFTGWPKSTITLFGHTVIVKEARAVQNIANSTLTIPCGKQTFLQITQLTAPSGRTMAGADFLRGYKK